MNEKVKRAIDEYLRKTERLLPFGFETEDLLDDLRNHIEEAFLDKTQERPDEDPVTLIEETLEELGAPEDIAKEYADTRPVEKDLDERREQGFTALGRLLFAIFVVVIVAFFLSVYTGGTLDFWFTLIVLLVLVIAEWFIRAWQAGESSPLDILKSR
ncbi:MAG: hypothetical protein EAX95_05595 [Candidatus Thorarchaeota archaeon]|nr:hypothetical protein [Candidatus Thorarchaeota archaeon]